MTDATRGGPRRRINAPRDEQEAKQLIAKLEQQFGLISMEDQLLKTLSAQREKYDARERQLVVSAIATVMVHLNADTLTVPSSVFAEIEAHRVKVTGAGDHITFTLENKE